MISILFLWAAGRAGASVTCERTLKAADHQAYVRAAEPYDFDVDRLVQSHEFLRGFFRDAFFADPARRDHWVRHEARRGCDEFSRAVEAEVTGRFDLRESAIAEVQRELAALPGRRPTKPEVRALVLEATSFYEIEDAFALGRVTAERGESVLRVHAGQIKVETSGKIRFGPREFVLAREVLQYARPRPDDRLLQIGFDSPATLTTLREFLPDASLEGVRPGLIKEAESVWAAHRAVWLARADLFAEPRRARTGYAAIFGLDQTQVTAAELPRLASMLKASGVVILVNDHGRAPGFTSADAERAGFTVVRWGRERPMPVRLRKMIYASGAPPAAGDLRAYVLRRDPKRP